MFVCFVLLPTLWLSPLASIWAQSGKETPAIEVVHPLKNQVFQRRFEVPQLSHSNHPGGPAKGFAQVPFHLKWTPKDPTSIEYRLQADSKNTHWLSLSNECILAIADSPGMTHLIIDVPAGGWYRVELRMKAEGQIVAHATSEPFGVGEVLLVAGQSYATNCNDERLQVADQTGRVVAYDFRKQSWNIAHDPQPAGDTSDGGSIWPPFGDLLVQAYGVPVG
ncbi:MAG: hypothetical protein ACK48K_16790, partial [Planctomycetota bacterium]